jgi:predicted ATP-grasp superfamily ATP-dependent carboligase
MCTWTSCRHSRWHVKIQPDLVIIAACARPYVVAARQAGYNIAAFDMFSDVDTRRFCVHSARVRYADGGFDGDDLLRQLHALDLSRVQGVAYGSGFEGQPQLLAQIAQRMPLLGNSPEVLAQVKSPKSFFPMLDRLGIAHPEISLHAPSPGDGWLIKTAGGSGGTHIRQSWQDIGMDDYFQRRLDGRSVSLLFLADGKQIREIGYNEQWCAPVVHMPYRYGGAVNQIDLAAEIRSQMLAAAGKITAHVDLRGLNSMDFIHGEDGLFLLEVNPRLSASMDLFDAPDLFAHHVSACRATMPEFALPDMQAKAHCIVYAHERLPIAADFEWPVWAADIPHPGIIQQHAPVCSVYGEAPLAEDAKALAFARTQELEAQLSAVQS